MFGLGPTEILLIFIVIISLVVALVIVVAIIAAVINFMNGKREAELEGRVDELEKRLREQEQK